MAASRPTSRTTKKEGCISVRNSFSIQKCLPSPLVNNRADVWTAPNVTIADLSGGLQYPVLWNDNIFSYGIETPNEELTHQAALWWDGQNSIYKYLPLSEISPSTLDLFFLLFLSIGWIMMSNIYRAVS